MSIVGRTAIDIDEWNVEKEELYTLADRLFPTASARIRRFRFIDDAKRAFAGQLLSRYHLLQTILKWKDISFVTHEGGKPMLSSHTLGILGYPLDFNTSHDGAFAILAGVKGNGLRIGVDVMRFKPPRRTETVDEFLSSFTEQFSKREWEQIRSSEDDSPSSSEVTPTLCRFYQFWAHKEAYVKAIGVGLSMPLDKVEFVLHDSKPTEMYIDGKLITGWIFEMQTIRSAQGHEHVCVIAVGTGNGLTTPTVQGLNEPWTIVSIHQGLELALSTSS